MIATAAQPSFEKQIRQIEKLVARIEQSSDPNVQTAAREMVQILLDLHGAGLAKMVEFIVRADGGREAMEACVDDDLVASLLLLHGLHPESLESRVLKALEKVRPRLNSHHGDVEYLGLRDGTVRLRLNGTCHGCPASRVTLQLAIEAALLEMAPDAAGIEVEGLAEPSASATAAQLEAAGVSAEGQLSCPSESR